MIVFLGSVSWALLPVARDKRGVRGVVCRWLILGFAISPGVAVLLEAPSLCRGPFILSSIVFFGAGEFCDISSRRFSRAALSDAGIRRSMLLGRFRGRGLVAAGRAASGMTFHCARSGLPLPPGDSIVRVTRSQTP